MDGMTPLLSGQMQQRRRQFDPVVGELVARQLADEPLVVSDTFF